MDNKKLGIVVLSFALGGLAHWAYINIINVYEHKKREKQFLADVYGKDVAEKMMKT